MDSSKSQCCWLQFLGYLPSLPRNKEVSACIHLAKNDRQCVGYEPPRHAVPLSLVIFESETKSS